MADVTITELRNRGGEVIDRGLPSVDYAGFRTDLDDVVDASL